MYQVNIKTSQKEEFIDCTDRIRKLISNSGVEQGVCTIFVPHTTAGVTINENADPAVKYDILLGLQSAFTNLTGFRHIEGNSPAHLKTSMIGSSESLLINKGSLVLGTWQGIFFCEFDGPRERKIFINIK